MRQALILSGAGSKIAWQVGALRKLLERFDLDPEIISGVSSGALLGAILSQYPKSGDSYPYGFKYGLEKAEDMLLSLRGSKDVWRDRFFWPISAFKGLSIKKTWPLKKLLKDHISVRKMRESGRRFFAGVYHLNTMDYFEVDQFADPFYDWLLASASFPLMFEPVKMVQSDGTIDLYADGGIREMVPVSRALDFLPSEIFILCVDPLFAKSPRREISNIFDVAKQVLTGGIYEIIQNDLYPLKKYLEKVPHAKIWLCYPRSTIDIDPLDFSPRLICDLINKGREECIIEEYRG